MCNCENYSGMLGGQQVCWDWLDISGLFTNVSPVENKFAIICPLSILSGCNQLEIFFANVKEPILKVTYVCK